MKAQKAKIKGNEPKRPKCKEMKAQKAKMKGNESSKDQNERKYGKKLQNGPGSGAAKSHLKTSRK